MKKSCGVHYLYVYDPNNHVSMGTKEPYDTPNIKDICSAIAKNIRMGNHERRSFNKDGVVYKMLKQDQRVYVVGCEKFTPLRIAFGLLETVADEIYDDPTLLNKSKLKKYLKRMRERYNDPNNDKIEECKTKIDMIKEVMSQNIDKILTTLDTTAAIAEQANELRTTGRVFRSRGRQVEHRQCLSMILIIMVVFCLCAGICLVLIVIFMMSTGLLGMIIALISDAVNESDTDDDGGDTKDKIANFVFDLIGL